MDWILNAIKTNNGGGDDDEMNNEDHNDNNNNSNTSVAQLVQRVESSQMYEDKMEALEELVELSSQPNRTKQFSNNESFQKMVQLLNSQRDDHVFTSQVLLIVWNLVSCPKMGEQYMSVIVSQSHYLSIVLNLLHNNTREYTRLMLYTLQLLSLLLRHNANLVQQAILSESVIPILVSTLVDQRETIQSQGMQLLNELSMLGSQEVKKIIVFEETFQKLFHIIFEEGGTDGGINVILCLQIIFNLIYENESNQKYLNEIKCVQYLYHLLLPVKRTVGDNVTTPVSPTTDMYANCSLSDHKVKIIMTTLEIVYELIKDPRRSDEMKLVLCNTSILNNIIALALVDFENVTISYIALFILGLIVYQFKPAQEILESFTFERPRSEVMEAAIVRLVRIVLYDENELKRQIANDCLRKFLFDNKEGQFIIASTIKAPTLVASSAEEGMLCGITLANAVLSYDKPKHHIAESFHGASVLSQILRQNNKCKDILLELPYEVNKGKRPIPFFECLIKATLQATKSRIHETLGLGLLQLLCYWISGSPASARSFMTNNSNLLFFLELVSPKCTWEYATVHTQGLGSLILGLLCIEYEGDDDNVAGYSKESLVDTVSKRVGIDRLNQLWNQLSTTHEFNIALQVDATSMLQTLPAQPTGFNVYDSTFATFASDVHSNIVSFFANPEKFIPSTPNTDRPNRSPIVEPPKPATPVVDETALNELKSIIKQQEEVKQLKEQTTGLQSSLDESKRNMTTLEEQLQKVKQEKEKLQQEQNNTSLLEEQHTEEIKNLQIQIEQLTHSLQERQSEITAQGNISEQNIKALNLQLNNKEQELENLSTAYEQIQTLFDEKEADSTRYQKQWKDEESKSRKLKQEKESLQSQLNQLSEQVAQTQQLQAKLGTLQESLQQSETAHSTKDSEIHELKNVVNQLQTQLSDINQQHQIEVQTSLKQQNESSEEIAKLRRLLEDKDKFISQLQTQFGQRFSEIENLKHEIAQKDQRIAELLPLELIVKQLEQQLSDNQQLLLARDEEITELNNQIIEKTQKIEEQERDNDDMMEIVEQLENKLAAFQSNGDEPSTDE